jgi:single-strand DNA-binding protein
MSTTFVTVVGNVTDEPRVHLTDDGNMVVNFRLACTERRRLPETDTWVDGKKLFVAVSCWRGFAENVAKSVHKGQPLMVHGRMFTHEYERDGQLRAVIEIEAVAIGHDLSRGRSEFTKVQRSQAVEVDVDQDGLPVQLPDPSWVELTGPEREHALTGR